MTKVINLYGGPGCGKSTLAAELYYRLKLAGVSTELVREYVKDWAWEGRKVGPYDQPLICGKQISSEAGKYGKVDVIVTDSPLLLAPFYQWHYTGWEYTSGVVQGHMQAARERGVQYMHYMLKRNKAYDTKGRYETEEEARAIDERLATFLRVRDIRLEYLAMPDSEKADAILKDLGVEVEE